jgi:transcriptional regulator with XRE-family HTH domain
MEHMLIGQRLRALREEKKLSQGDIEKRTGLFRCYTSRVENGATVPSIPTLEKYARALEIPMYALFYDGEEPPKAPVLPNTKNGRETEWGNSGKDAHMLRQFQRVLSRTTQSDQKLLLHMARKMASANRIKE